MPALCIGLVYVLALARAGDPSWAAMFYHQAAVHAAAGAGDEVRALRLVTVALETNPYFHPTQDPEPQVLIEPLDL